MNNSRILASAAIISASMGNCFSMGGSLCSFCNDEIPLATTAPDFGYNSPGSEGGYTPCNTSKLALAETSQLCPETTRPSQLIKQKTEEDLEREEYKRQIMKPFESGPDIILSSKVQVPSPFPLCPTSPERQSEHSSWWRDPFFGTPSHHPSASPSKITSESIKDESQVKIACNPNLPIPVRLQPIVASSSFIAYSGYVLHGISNTKYKEKIKLNLLSSFYSVRKLNLEPETLRIIAHDLEAQSGNKSKSISQRIKDFNDLAKQVSASSK